MSLSHFTYSHLPLFSSSPTLSSSHRLTLFIVSLRLCVHFIFLYFMLSRPFQVFQTPKGLLFIRNPSSFLLLSPTHLSILLFSISPILNLSQSPFLSPFHSSLTSHLSSLFTFHFPLFTYFIFFGGTTDSFSSNPLLSTSFATSDCLLINISCAAVVIDSALRFRTSFCSVCSFLTSFS